MTRIPAHRTALAPSLCPAFLLMAMTASAAAQQFAPRERLFGPAAVAPFQCLPFDFDGDGDLDLVSTHGTGPGVRVWEHEGVGTGRFLAAEPLGPLAGAFQGLQAGDLDGDGRPDLVVYNGAVDRVDVIWREAVGVSPPQLVHGGPRVPYDGALADVDGDGDLDILLPHTGTTTLPDPFSWIENLGARQFAAPVALASFDSESLEVVVGDIDGDGDVDIVGYETLGRALFFRRDPAGYTLAQSIPAFSSGASVRLRGLHDLDQDGDLDLHVATSTPQGVIGDYVVEFDAVGGMFGGLTLVAGSSGRALAVDVTDDGVLDLVEVPNGADAGLLFRGLGGVSFGVPESLGAGTGLLESSLLGADMDADGRNDLVSFGDDGITWLRGAPAQGGAGAALDPAVRVIDWILNSASGFAAVDVDGDSDLDVAVGTTRDGAFDLERPSLGELVYRDRFPAVDAPRIQTLEGRDVDGDGLQDLVWRDPEDQVFCNPGLPGGGLGPAHVVAQLAPSNRAPLWVDLDADGDLDLIERSASTTAVRWFQQEPVGTFLAPATLLATVNPVQRLDVGDVNGDGLPDVVAALLLNGSRIRVRWYAGAGGGALAAGETIEQFSGEIERLRCVDLNGDGRAEVVRDNSPFAPMLIRWLNPATSTFTDSVSFAHWQRTERAILEDVDGDGRADLLLFSTQGSSVRWLRALGGYSYGDEQSLPLPGAEIRAVEFMDYDQDGDLDLLALNERFGGGFFESRIHMYRNNAVGTPGESYCGPAQTNSAGFPAEVTTIGSAVVSENDLRLRAAGLPIASTTLFLTSRLEGFVTQPGGSQGNLCLGGSIGRFVGPGQVQVSSASGSAELALDLTSLPQPTGSVAALPGETWYFQSWYRDSVAGQPTSNFTNGREVLMR